MPRIDVLSIYTLNMVREICQILFKVTDFLKRVRMIVRMTSDVSYISQQKLSSCSKSREADKHGNVILGSVGWQGGSVENKNDYLWHVMKIV